VYSGVPHGNRGNSPESWHIVCIIFGRDNLSLVTNIVEVLPHLVPEFKIMLSLIYKKQLALNKKKFQMKEITEFPEFKNIKLLSLHLIW